MQATGSKKMINGKGDLEMYDLSVCLAAIRKHNWEKLYNSIVESVGNYTFEIIFCGPHEEPPEALKGLENVRCVHDYGPPTRAQQIAIGEATGRYLTWTADDGWFFPNKLAQCIELLDKTNNEKAVIVTQYIEGGSDGLGDPNVGMYCMNFHDPVRSPYYPNSFLIFNSVVMSTKFLKEWGGFDCRFEACPMAYVDFGARAQKDGAKVFLAEAIYECTQFPGTSGDHAPIHHAQLDHDQPLYSSIWTNPSCQERLKIDFNNWKTAPDIWERRFSDLKQQEAK